MFSSQGDGLNEFVEDNFVGGFNQRNVVGKGVSVVVGMVHKSGKRVLSSSAQSQMGSNDDDGVGSGSSNSAVSSANGPPAVMHPATAEVGITSGSVRGLVWELTRVGIRSTNNSSLPSSENITRKS